MARVPDFLIRYAVVHRDERNIAMHMAGVPLTVLAVGLLLAQPSWVVWGQSVTPAWAVASVAFILYTYAAGRLGFVTGLFILMAFAFARGMTHLSLSTVNWGIALLVTGWLLQRLGHWYEGRQLGWQEILRGLVAAPLFVTSRIGADLGWFKAENADIEARVGPSYLRDVVSARL